MSHGLLGFLQGSRQMRAIAQRIRADYLLTRDKTGFVKSSVPVMAPREFLALLKDKYNYEYDMIDL